MQQLQYAGQQPLKLGSLLVGEASTHVFSQPYFSSQFTLEQARYRRLGRLTSTSTQSTMPPENSSSASVARRSKRLMRCCGGRRCRFRCRSKSCMRSTRRGQLITPSSRLGWGRQRVTMRARAFLRYIAPNFITKFWFYLTGVLQLIPSAPRRDVKRLLDLNGLQVTCDVFLCSVFLCSVFLCSLLLCSLFLYSSLPSGTHPPRPSAALQRPFHRRPQPQRCNHLLSRR